MYKLVGLREVKNGEYVELHLTKIQSGLKIGNTVVEKVFCKSDVLVGTPSSGCTVDVRYMPGFNGRAYVSQIEFK